MLFPMKCENVDLEGLLHNSTCRTTVREPFDFNVAVIDLSSNLT